MIKKVLNFLFATLLSLTIVNAEEIPKNDFLTSFSITNSDTYYLYRDITSNMEFRQTLNDALIDEPNSTITVYGELGADSSNLFNVENNENISCIIFDENINTENMLITAYMFENCINVTDINIENLDTSNVINMVNMFHNNKSLKSLNLSNFVTKHVTNMTGLFTSCESLTFLDLSNFVTDKVKSMSYMFAGCKNLVDIDLSTIRTHNVENMSYMFYACHNIEHLLLTNFETKLVNNFWNMFANCYVLKTLDLNHFIINNANTFGMLDNTPRLECFRLPSVIMNDIELEQYNELLLYNQETNNFEITKLSNTLTSNNNAQIYATKDYVDPTIVVDDVITETEIIDLIELTPATITTTETDTNLITAITLLSIIAVIGVSYFVYNKIKRRK